MTGIALGLTEVAKIALGNTDILKVSLGSVDIWPSAPPIGEFLLRGNIPFTGNFFSLAFQGPTAFFGYSIIANAQLGQIDENTHPGSWAITSPPAMFVRADIESQVLNGGSFSMLANNINYTPGTWVQINPTSNSFEMRGGGGAIIGQTTRTVVRLQISSTTDGGNVVYDNRTDFSILRT